MTLLSIGPWKLSARTVLAPMAGVTDRPFRILCRQFGAGLAISEMITSDQRLWDTIKSRQRMNHEGEPEPRAVQLAGNDPAQLADAARANVDLGAQIIDINMGCPGEESVRQAVRLGAARGPAAGGADPGRGGAGRGRAGHGEDPHRAGSLAGQRAARFHASQQQPACAPSRCTAARARIFIREMLSTKPSARSARTRKSR